MARPKHDTHLPSQNPHYLNFRDRDDESSSHILLPGLEFSHRLPSPAVEESDDDIYYDAAAVEGALESPASGEPAPLPRQKSPSPLEPRATAFTVTRSSNTLDGSPSKEQIVLPGLADHRTFGSSRLPGLTPSIQTSEPTAATKAGGGEINEDNSFSHSQIRPTQHSVSSRWSSGTAVNMQAVDDLLQRRYSIAIDTLRDLYHCGITFDNLVSHDFIEAKDRKHLEELFKSAGLPVQQDGAGYPSATPSVQAHASPQVKAKATAASRQVDRDVATMSASAHLRDTYHNVPTSTISTEKDRATEYSTRTSLVGGGTEYPLPQNPSPRSTDQTSTAYTTFSGSDTKQDNPPDRSSYLAKLAAAKKKKSPQGVIGSIANQVVMGQVTDTLSQPGSLPLAQLTLVPPANGQSQAPRDTPDKNVLLQQKLAALRERMAQSRLQRPALNGLVAKQSSEAAALLDNHNTTPNVVTSSTPLDTKPFETMDETKDHTSPFLNGLVARGTAPKPLQKPSPQIVAYPQRLPRVESEVKEDNSRSRGSSLEDDGPHVDDPSFHPPSASMQLAGPQTGSTVGLESGAGSPFAKHPQIAQRVPREQHVFDLDLSEDSGSDMEMDSDHESSMKSNTKVVEMPSPSSMPMRSAMRSYVADTPFSPASTAGHTPTASETPSQFQQALKAKELEIAAMKARIQLQTQMRKKAQSETRVAPTFMSESVQRSQSNNVSIGDFVIDDTGSEISSWARANEPITTLSALPIIAPPIDGSAPGFAQMSTDRPEPASPVPQPSSNAKRPAPSNDQDFQATKRHKLAQLQSKLAAKKKQMEEEYRRRMLDLQAEIDAEQQATTAGQTANNESNNDTPDPNIRDGDQTGALNDVASVVGSHAQTTQTANGLERLRQPPEPSSGAITSPMTARDGVDASINGIPDNEMQQATPQAPSSMDSSDGSANDSADSTEALSSAVEDGEVDNEEYEPSTEMLQRPAPNGPAQPGESPRESLTDGSMSESSGEISEGEIPTKPAPSAAAVAHRIDQPVDIYQAGFNTNQTEKSAATQQLPSASKYQRDAHFQPWNPPKGPRQGPWQNTEPPRGPRADRYLNSVLGITPPAISSAAKGVPRSSEAFWPSLDSDSPTFTAYESPLKHFRDYRYHPQYESTATGYQSLTYSHNIDPGLPFCRFELAGVCNDPQCPNQHLRQAALDGSQLLMQLGGKNPGHTPEEQEAYKAGLRDLIASMKDRSLQDPEQIAAELVTFRRDFLQDPSKILNL